GSAPLVFATASYGYLRGELVRAGRFDAGAVEVTAFPDGERYQRIVTPVSGRDVVLLAGTISDGDTLELFDLACGLVSCGARTLAVVIPYFGYSTMERAVHPGEVVTAKTRARLISSIPPCEGGTRVFLFDLHTDGIAYYFGDSHITRHLYGATLIA